MEAISPHQGPSPTCGSTHAWAHFSLFFSFLFLCGMCWGWERGGSMHVCMHACVCICVSVCVHVCAGDCTYVHVKARGG